MSKRLYNLTGKKKQEAIKNIDLDSDRLLHEIMNLEHEIEKIMALNGNREDSAVRQYRKFILAKKNKLKKLNDDYRDLLHP